MSLWAIKTLAGDVFTLGGKVIVHGNRAELEFLFPHRQFADMECSALPMMRLWDHPDMAGIRFPLHREDFR